MWNTPFNASRQRVACPFCGTDGCCFCDHEGHIWVGAGCLISSQQALTSIGVQYLKETDPGETWPEMWAHALNEDNVPQEFKDRINRETMSKAKKQSETDRKMKDYYEESKALLTDDLDRHLSADHYQRYTDPDPEKERIIDAPNDY